MVEVDPRGQQRIRDRVETGKEIRVQDFLGEKAARPRI